MVIVAPQRPTIAFVVASDTSSMANTANTADISPLAVRVQDIDATPNENPIPDLEDVPLLTVRDAIEFAQQRDEELGKKNMQIFVQCAEMFADRRVKNTSTVGEVLNIDEIASIHLYTQESPFYAIFNARMRDKNRHRVKPFLPFLKIILTALYKLPVVSGVTLYRGIKGDMRNTFTTHPAQMWWGINSTTRKVEVLDNAHFLGTDGKRTMLHIHAVNAYDISAYSAVGETEHEVILPPGTVVQVESIATPTPDLCIVQLKQQEYHKLIGGGGGAGAGSGVKHDLCPQHPGKVRMTWC